jgi:hypothetical protein
MMQYNRETYLQDRVNNYVRFELAWEMYDKNTDPNKPPLNQQDFIKCFRYWIQSQFCDLSGYWDYFDRIFDIVFVISPEGQVIKMI